MELRRTCTPTRHACWAAPSPPSQDASPFLPTSSGLMYTQGLIRLPLLPPFLFRSRSGLSYYPPKYCKAFNYSSCLDGYCSLNVFSIFCPYNPSGCNDVFPVSAAAQNPIYSLRNKTDFHVHKTVPLWQAPFPLQHLSTTSLNSPLSIIVVHSGRRDC